MLLLDDQCHFLLETCIGLPLTRKEATQCSHISPVSISLDYKHDRILWGSRGNREATVCIGLKILIRSKL